MNTEQPSLPIPPLPVPREDKRRPFWFNPWFWFAMILLACVFWQWRESRSLIQETRQDIAQRLAENERTQRESLARIDKGLQDIAEVKRGQTTLDARMGEMEGQAAALQNLYQEATLSHDEALLTEIEQHIHSAQQQLQLAGNVEAAILALQAADNRLQNKEARFLPLRRALTNDLGKLQAMPFVDIAGMSLKLESVITEIDRMPLILDIVPEDAMRTPAKETVKAAEESPARWQDTWRVLGAQIWQEFRGLVRIRRLDRQLPELISPEEGFILRENLKLRLLNARLALLMRDSWTYKNELVTAEERLARYFNPSARTTQVARATLSQLAGMEINVIMPALNESAMAVQQLRNNREAR